MQEIVDLLVNKINNNTITLQDFNNIIVKYNIVNIDKFIALLCKNDIIEKYLNSYFKEENIDNDILISYGKYKNLIKEKEGKLFFSNIKDLDSQNLFYNDLDYTPQMSREDTLKYLSFYKEAKSLNDQEKCNIYRNKIIEGNIRFILLLAKKHAHASLSLTDLINEGFFGMAKAIDNFDEKYNASFATYASYWINQQMQNSLYNNFRSIKIPNHIQVKYKKYKAVKQNLDLKLGREATTLEVADAMNMSEDNLNKIISHFTNVYSLDSYLLEQTPLSRYNVVSNNSSFTDDIINKETVLKLFECLNEREKDIIIKRYVDLYTLEKIGQIHHITKERVRQIEAIALDKMKCYYKGVKFIRKKKR